MNIRVLVAEDEYLMRDRLLVMLQTCWPQAQVVCVAENGNDAWDGFLEHEPEVVFLDIRMPGLSGLDVAQRIEQQIDIAGVLHERVADQIGVVRHEVEIPPVLLG